MLGNLKAGLREAEVLELPPGAAIQQVPIAASIPKHALVWAFSSSQRRLSASVIVTPYHRVDVHIEPCMGGFKKHVDDWQTFDDAFGPPCSAPAWWCCAARCAPRRMPRTCPHPAAPPTRRAATPPTPRTPVGAARHLRQRQRTVAAVRV